LREEILEPDLPIVDPHHHLWDRPGSRYYLELLADLNSGHKIVATVFLQCFWSYRTEGPEEMRPVGETEFVASVAAEAERRNGARGCMFDSNFPVDQGNVQLPGAVEWLQAHRRRRISGRSACTIPRHRNAVLPHPNLIGLGTI
jgi:predicted TIM-barrel fold metal-dependent hydrolase